MAVVDHIGYAKHTWGIAEDIPHFAREVCLLDTELALLIQGAYRGVPGVVYLNGVRYFASAYQQDDVLEVLVMVVAAQEEAEAKRLASTSSRSAEALRRIGKTLTMNQNLHPLCQAATHEIASALNLAAVLLWVQEGQPNGLELAATVGANRQGVAALQSISTDGETTCSAELAAGARRTFRLNNVSENMITANLEAKFCYLTPGAMTVIPLLIGDRVIGVLELIAREDDRLFAEDDSLYATIGEHLALALNTAMLFDSIEKLATKDPLTGIANHRAMQEFLTRRLTEAARTSADLGMIMVDVDHFRAFNEEEGHEVGDEVLKHVVEVILQSIRPYDLAARYGGEEFVVILPNSSPENTLASAERIRDRVEQIKIVTRSGRVRHVTASFGVATFPHTSRDESGLMRAADAAMYEAKRQGRNRVVAYQGPLLESPARTTLDLDALEPWLEKVDREASAALRNACQEALNLFVRELMLTKGQERMLHGLMKLAPRVLRATNEGDDEFLRTLQKAPEIRVLLPALSSLNERFDGEGPMQLSSSRIPLLARVMHVLLALGGIFPSPAADPGRYDPDLIQLLSGLSEAA